MDFCAGETSYQAWDRRAAAAVSSVCSFICLSAVILHNYTLSNQKMREGRGREQPASWQERRGEENGPLLRSQSRTLGPLDDGARRRSVPSLLFDRLVVLLQTKWARCKNMQCIGLHHLTLCVTSLSNFHSRRVSRCWRSAEVSVSVVTLQ